MNGNSDLVDILVNILVRHAVVQCATIMEEGHSKIFEKDFYTVCPWGNIFDIIIKPRHCMLKY